MWFATLSIYYHNTEQDHEHECNYSVLHDYETWVQFCHVIRRLQTQLEADGLP